MERFRALTPTVWAVGGIGGLMALSVVHPSMLWRYAIPAIPAIAMLQADAVLAAHRHMGRGLRRFGFVPARIGRSAPVLPVVVLALVLTAQMPLQVSQQNPWAEAADVLARRGRDGDGILTPQRTARMPLDYAWSQREVLPDLISLQPSQSLGQLRRYDNWLRQSVVIEAVAEVDRMWVVLLNRPTQPPEVDQLMGYSAIDDQFEEVERHEFRDVILILLERVELS